MRLSWRRSGRCLCRVRRALRKVYGPKILYQSNVTTGKPDSLHVDEKRPLILDTKYKPRYGVGAVDVDDVRQLAVKTADKMMMRSDRGEVRTARAIAKLHP